MRHWCCRMLAGPGIDPGSWSNTAITPAPVQHFTLVEGARWVFEAGDYKRLCVGSADALLISAVIRFAARAALKSAP